MFWTVLWWTGLVVLLIGLSTLVWATAGLVRVIAAARSRRSSVPRPAPQIAPEQVAVLIAAHNESLVLPTTLRSALGQFEAHQIFVASDGSSDGTGAIARSFGVNVLELNPNRGKAGAIAAALEHFRLAERFEAVMLLDADTVLHPRYLESGLALFDADDVVAVAGTAASISTPYRQSLVGRILGSYRVRVYCVVQYLHKYGQAARGLNAVWIVPGFASMYRSRVLSSVEITAPGLTIEDYNMTFELHAKRLGRIAFNPTSAIAYTQDPDTVRDYAKQVGRWSLGFWQTVLRHRWRPNRFWAGLTLFIVELLFGSIAFLLAAPAVLISAAATLASAGGIDHSGVSTTISLFLPLPLIFFGAFLPDYLLTVFSAVVARRPVLLLFGLVFPFVRLLDAAIFLHRLPEAVLADSNGTWSSPPRRSNVGHGLPSAAPASEERVRA